MQPTSGSGTVTSTDEPLHLQPAAPVPETMREVDRSGEPVFELRAISHSYGRNKVIFDVDLSVWPGEVVGLVGDNGAGKSTLLKIFAGYQRPTSGTLRFQGKDVRFGSPADARATRHRGRLPGPRDRRPAEPVAELLPRQGARAAHRPDHDHGARPHAGRGARRRSRSSG